MDNKTIILLITGGFIIIGLMWIPNISDENVNEKVLVESNQSIEKVQQEKSNTNNIKETFTWIVGIIQTLLAMTLMLKKILTKK